ncbi:uncharacterized protein B0P05DRAFT_562136 [Gilbertella persicaria]|uniref:uncharacterized protein n=1 Tax=Gilbertella persicaria TaxID=101096 RepID=UPI00222098E5|nr:uncharacterized protein B0P05DRAFT_562136 [Gilbertella persicaria]KAI8052605.1 hypothetical protein B0P05DRAFT_562136 [Gilbertella persicaria]
MNNTKNDAMNNTKPMTDAELEAQFVERNQNLKQTIHSFVDKIDSAATKTQDFLEHNASSMANAQTSNATATTTTVPTGGRLSTMTVGTGNFNNGIRATTATHTGEDDISMDNNIFDRKAMSSIQHEIQAMHSSDPEIFEEVATKMDETFGHNALV